jgi:hypothetical protein
VTVSLTVVCDRCCEQIFSGRSAFDLRCGPLKNRVDSFDVCTDCSEELVAWLGLAGQAAEPAPAPKKDPPARASSPRPTTGAPDSVGQPEAS